MKSFDIGGVHVEFPYDAYECQILFIEKVIEALKNSQNAALESPTGTGKTLCLLCASVAFVKDFKTKITVAADGTVSGSASGSLYPKVFYASRTHSQLSQVIRELNKTIYKDVKVVTLASRDVLCINDAVLKEPNNNVKSLMCRNLVRQRRCHFFNQFEKSDVAAMDLLYVEDGMVPDIEDIVRIGRRHRHCPFYRNRLMYETADLILLPYNYILDPCLRQMHNIKLKGNIIIFDEAHNLESVCEESVSISLSTTELSGCIREAKTVLEMLMKDEEDIRNKMDNCDEPFGEASKADDKKEITVSTNDVAQLITMMQSFEVTVDEFAKSSKGGRSIMRLEGKVFPGGKMIDLLEKAGIRKDIREEISVLTDKMGQYLTHKASEQENSMWSEKKDRLQHFSSFVSTVYAESYDPLAPLVEINSRRAEIANNHRTATYNAENFELFVTNTGTTINLNYWCFTPSVAMRYVYTRGVRSIIVTSGTLSPLELFTNSLGIDMRITLENDHVATKQQIMAACIKEDDNGNLICGTYNNRNDAYFLGIGSVIQQACCTVPEGMLVFFSSYIAMNLCIAKWKESLKGNGSLWNQMSRFKKLFEEPKCKAELNLVLCQYREAVREQNGAVLFAVCRAKVSEGIDFSDCESRAVIIVGVPFAPTTNPRIELKKQFLNEHNAKAAKSDKTRTKMLSSDEWYQVDAVRAVNQALGRVLRHKNDFGVVILADSRFCSMDRKRFPSWIRDGMKNFNKIRDFEPECVRFFRDHGVKTASVIRTVNNPVTEKNCAAAIVGAIKRKVQVCIRENANSLNEINKLYPANDAMPAKKRSPPVDVSENNSKPCSAIARIEEMNTTGKNRKPTAEEPDIEIIDVIGKPSGTTYDRSARKKIKLKPNCSTNIIKENTVLLESFKRTPVQYARLLKAIPSSNAKEVRDALCRYSSSKDFSSFISSLEAAVLPSYPGIFRAVYGFLFDEHRQEFAVKCRQLNLLQCS